MVSQNEERYWSASRAFVRAMIGEIDSSLGDSIKSKSKRRDTCSEIAFSLAQMIDQRWVNSSGKTEYPNITYTSEPLDIDTQLSEVQFCVPVPQVELHPMVTDEIDWYYDTAPDTLMLSGLVGDTPPNQGDSDDSDVALTQPCNRCKGTSQCFCIRKGGGVSPDCPRCSGTGVCSQCKNAKG